MRISDWSSDVCSADLDGVAEFLQRLRVDRGGEPPGAPGRLGRLHRNAVAGPGRRGGAGRNAQKNGREGRGGNALHRWTICHVNLLGRVVVSLKSGTPGAVAPPGHERRTAPLSPRWN